MNHKIFSINESTFEPVALEVFRHQYRHNKVYHDFVDLLHVDVSAIHTIEAIPFLPISFFKSHKIQTGDFNADAVFESSGSTQAATSKHYVKDLGLYRESFTRAFERCYGPASDYCIIGLLPSYIERGNSSLTLMVNDLAKMSRHPASGFYLDEHEKLFQLLEQLESMQQKTLLIGVTFGLLDFAEKYQLSLQYTIVMETGGMKGRREEVTRQQVHDILKARLGVQQVHSEYGMTELLSQAYSKGQGLFSSPPWMKVLLREEDDPMVVWDSVLSKERTGVMNIIDLANIDSCAFIATDDVGKMHAGGQFEVLGRMDNSDIRGCSLMVV